MQHFWSLSVEEQFYLGWPILILLIVVLARLLRAPDAPLLFTGLAAVVLASFWYSIEETAANPARAFFVTPTRVWELGVGGLLAVAQARHGLARHRWLPARASRPLALTAVWGGLAAIAGAMLEFGANTPWPGWHALVPTLEARR